MDYLNECTVGCPYCGELLKVLIDEQDMGQRYIEDCQVCCRPITFVVGSDSMGGLEVSVHSEDDAI